MRRLLCLLGRHDWRLAYVRSHSGEEYGESRPSWIAPTYLCRRCPARRTEATP